MSASILDDPRVQNILFYPRRDDDLPPDTEQAISIWVEVEPGVRVGGRLYPATAPQAPAILFFHGNGEIASDYDGLSSLYTRLGIHLLVMDYRGYGTSDDMPTARHLLADAVTIFRAAPALLAQHNLALASLYTMGRSLGSAAAIEIAAVVNQGLAGLIVESGFADTLGLLARLGLPLRSPDKGPDAFGNANKISRVTIPTLVIHGQADVLIPAADAQELYRHSAASDKRLVLVPGAGHNDLLMVGLDRYMQAIEAFVRP